MVWPPFASWNMMGSYSFWSNKSYPCVFSFSAVTLVNFHSSTQINSVQQEWIIKSPFYFRWFLSEWLSLINIVFCFTATRRCWAPQRQHWPWTGISAQPCCLCWHDVRLSLLIRSTTRHSWTPHFTPSTDCPRAAHSPRPRETPLRSAYLPSASKGHVLIQPFMWKFNKSIAVSGVCINML